MITATSFPNPVRPGAFDIEEFGDDQLYESRWASHPNVVTQVLKGSYDLITPVLSEFVPTLRCPYCCPYCHFRNLKEEASVWGKDCAPCGTEMHLASARGYLDKLASGGCQAILITGGGEPTMHPGLRAIVRHAKSRGLRISMSTNGTFAGGGFDPEDTIRFGFDTVRISLDSVEHHDTFHGYNKTQHDWCKVTLSNLRRIGAHKADTSMSLVVCIVFDERNYGELGRIGETICTLPGVDELVVRPVIDYFGDRQVPKEIVEQARELIETKLRPAVAKSGIQVFVPAHRLISLGGARRAYTACRACGLFGQVWPDGRMFICTETNGVEDFCIGDLNSQSLKEIYASPRYHEVRRRVGQERFARCPVTCRPARLNRLFQQIEDLKRSAGGIERLHDWATALMRQHDRPCSWIGL